MNDFKIGSRVKLINLKDVAGRYFSPCESNTVGNIGTIVADFKDEHSMCSVKWDNNSMNSYFTFNLELLDEEECTGSCIDE